MAEFHPKLLVVGTMLAYCILGCSSGREDPFGGFDSEAHAEALRRAGSPSSTLDGCLQHVVRTLDEMAIDPDSYNNANDEIERSFPELSVALVYLSGMAESKVEKTRIAAIICICRLCGKHSHDADRPTRMQCLSTLQRVLPELERLEVDHLPPSWSMAVRYSRRESRVYMQALEISTSEAEINH